MFWKGHQLVILMQKHQQRPEIVFFWLINVLFSDEMCPKFEQLGEKKDTNVLDTSLVANDEYFWQEVTEKYKEMNDDDNLAFVESIFLSVDPSVKLDHSWSKLWESFKGLTKSHGEIFENHKKVAMMTISSTSVVQKISLLLVFVA